MMATTKSLEDRIREKAVQEYEQMAMRGAESFFKSLGFTTYREFNLGVRPSENEKFRSLDLTKLYREIVKQSVDMRRQELGDRAVEAFLKRIDTLQNEVDDIRDIVNS